MQTQTVSEQAARVRAARAYASIDQETLATAASTSRATITRIEAGRRRINTDEQRAIASACNLPVEWFHADFGRLGELTETPSELSEIKRDLMLLRKQIQQLSRNQRPLR